MSESSSVLSPLKRTCQKVFFHPRRGWLAQTALAAGVCVLLFLGAQQGAEPLPSEHAAALSGQAQDGEQIYMTRCASCHQSSGQGVPGSFPPLDGTEWVQGDKGRLIRILLQGLIGETEVQGVTYSGAMPPWGSALDDEQIAAVATYIRTSWSNDTTAVTADEVAAVRAVTSDRTRPWTAEELKQEENLGIPGQEDQEE